MNNIKKARLLVEFYLTELTDPDFDLNEMRDMFQLIIADYLDMFPLVDPAKNDLQIKDTDQFRAWQIVDTCLDACNDSVDDLSIDELFDLIDTVMDKDGEDDFYIDDLPGGECRLIHGDDIDQIWEESLIEQIKDCYDLSNLPDFVKIDWQATTKNCMLDGKGHHFGTYDGSEHFCNGYYIFRTN